MSTESNKPKGWYLDLMAKKTRPEEWLAWLDPSTVYANKDAFSDCVEDLIRPFLNDEIDLVAGIDATGFILGAAIAQRLGKGFLIMRKTGRLCVDTDVMEYYDYQKMKKSMEIRKNAFPPGTKVLIIDQWVETGGTMEAAIKLVEGQQGIVAGIAAICFEEFEITEKLKKKYKWNHCTPEERLDELRRRHFNGWGSQT